MCRDGRTLAIISCEKGAIYDPDLNSCKITFDYSKYCCSPSALLERLRTHKVLTKDQCFYLNYYKFSVKSYVLDVY